MKIYLISALLGSVEGMTEFIPIGAPVHLYLIATILHINLSSSFWGLYQVVIELGAVLALIAVCLRGSHFWRLMSLKRTNSKRVIQMPAVLLIGWAVLSTVFSSFLILGYGRRGGDGSRGLGMSLLLEGIAMWVVDNLFGGGAIGSAKNVSVFQAIWVGLCQTISFVFPGAPRSAVTITSGQLSGLTRSAAVEFSYLLFAPTMLAKTFLDLYQIGPGADRLMMNGRVFAIFAIGFLASALVGYFSASWMLNQVRKHRLISFAAYNVCLGSTLLLLISLPRS